MRCAVQQSYYRGFVYLDDIYAGIVLPYAPEIVKVNVHIVKKNAPVHAAVAHYAEGLTHMLVY